MLACAITGAVLALAVFTPQVSTRDGATTITSRIQLTGQPRVEVRHLELGYALTATNTISPIDIGITVQGPVTGADGQPVPLLRAATRATLLSYGLAMAAAGTITAAIALILLRLLTPASRPFGRGQQIRTFARTVSLTGLTGSLLLGLVALQLVTDNATVTVTGDPGSVLRATGITTGPGENAEQVLRAACAATPAGLDPPQRQLLAEGCAFLALAGQ